MEMKIVVNARFLTQKMTGVQRFGVEISLILKRLLGDKVRFVSPQGIKQNDYAQILEVEIVGNHSGYMWEQLDLPFYLRKQGWPLLLNLCNMAPVFYKNKVTTIHDIAFVAYPQTFSKKFLFVYRVLIPCIIRTSKCLITVSNFSKEEICRNYNVDENNVMIVYNAVSDDFIHIADKKLEKRQYFLAVSSLNYRKNFLSVLKAFELFTKRNSAEYLYIVGDLNNDSFKGVDIKEFKKNSRIVFLGRVSDDELRKYYSNSLGFIYPSIYEGFGIPPLEAQACGCPILVSDIPPLKEVFQNSALYCNPYDVEDIANKMEELLAMRDEFIMRGNDNIKRYSWNNSAEKIMELVENVIL